MRLWSQDLTSVMIAKLHDFNAFFGLQGESEYYQPLMKRVVEIASSGQQVVITQSSLSLSLSLPPSNAVSCHVEQVVITGHSLGGGLARIVGSLTEQLSVSFSPPGIAMSYRKYSMQEADGSYRCKSAPTP